MSELDRDGRALVSGRLLVWRALGSGRPMLLVQGYAGTADDWHPDFLEALARSFAVLAPDNRGMGGSELGDPAELTIGSMAVNLEALLDEMEIDRIPVVGFSMGGFIAQALALRAPERVESLALLSTDPGGPAAIRADPSNWGRLVNRSGTPREWASRMISVVFPPEVAPEVDREFGELVAAANADLDPAALSAEERAMGEWWEEPPGAEGLPADAAVLVLAGAEDVVIPPGNAELLARRFPGARVERFEGTGHALSAQWPERSAELIRSHIGP